MKQALEAALRLLELADMRKRVHQPERAEKERTLLTVQPVLALVHAIPVDEHAVAEMLCDRPHRRMDTRVLVREKAHLADAQDGRVECVVVELLRERAAMFRPSARRDRPVDAKPGFLPR